MLKIMQIYQQQSTQVSQYTLCLKLERFLEIIILNTVQKITIDKKQWWITHKNGLVLQIFWPS